MADTSLVTRIEGNERGKAMRKAKIDFAALAAENRVHFPNGSRPANACAKCGCAILDGQLATRTLSGGPAVHSLSADCATLGQSFRVSR